ncbi:O-antigen ligase family protein [Brevibacillus sp. SYSU BS000544]|uniref:O-antigen ligase family protein n=1 Tax=Brevibacillus sp. SYSU BS000544 TaxID=3416443 RepID=UPI003CE56E93
MFLPRQTVYMLTCILMIAAGYVLQVIIHPSDSGVVLLIQTILVIGIFLIMQLTIQSTHVAWSWYRAFGGNVVALLVFAWITRGEELLSSVFDYANALALLCMMAIFWIFHEWTVAERKQQRYFWFVLFLLAGLSLLATGARIAWGLTGVGLFVQSLLFANQLDKRKFWLYWGGLVGLSVLTAGFLAWYDPSIRLELTQVSSLRIRLIYYWDAIRMILDHPFLGVGVDGWSKLQYQYQTAFYSVQHVHNHLLQLWLDAGILPVMGWVVLILLVFFDIIRIRRLASSSERKALVTIWLSTVAVLAYSFLDFIVSFPAILMSILFYWVFRNLLIKDIPTLTIKLHHSLIYGVSIVLITVGIVGGYREWHAFQANIALEQGNLHTVLQYEGYSRLSMSDQSRNMVLGKAYMEKAKRTQRKADWEKANFYFQKGYERDTEDYRFYPPLIYTSIQLNQKELAVQYSTKLIQLQPAVIEGYEWYAKSLFEAGKYHEVNQIPQLVETYQKLMLKKALIKQHIVDLTPSTQLNQIIQEANQKLANPS